MGKMNYQSEPAQRRIDRIQSVLRGQELTVHEISALIHLTFECTKGYIKVLHTEQLIYIAGYRRNPVRGNFLPLYRWGIAADAPKPKPLTERERLEAAMEDDPMAHDLAKARRKLRDFKPHCDWAAAWVPTRSPT